MVPVRALPHLAVRRMRRNCRLLSSVATGTLVAAAILSTTAIYADAIRDLGLAHAVAAADARDLDIRVTQTNTPVNEATYTSTREAQADAVGGVTQGTADRATTQGMSATFYVDAINGETTPPGNQRPRANLMFRDGLDTQVELIEGVVPPAASHAASGPIDVLLGSGTAEAHGLGVGDLLAIQPFWQSSPQTVEIRIAGIIREVEPEARYWGAVDERLDARERSWSTYRLWIPSETFFGQFRSTVPTVTAEYFSVYTINFERVNARNAIEIARGMSGLGPTLVLAAQRTTYQSSIEGLLRSYDEKLFFTQIPLLVLLLQIGAIVAYYLVMVSTMLVERQAAEIATMRSRGATTAQLLGIYGVEGTILAAAAGAVGPVIAGGVISLLGPTPAFRDLSGGGFLDVHVGTGAYLLAGVGALIAFVSLMIPAWRATRNSVVEFKRGAARPGQTPL
ncbi:MAG: hypothetical protein O2888_02910, partial [Chloroflexi bacterium]|nr:hypothetical protein [Chloroflexota bacterium]